MTDGGIMKTLILLMIIFSLPTQAQSPHFDSCGSSISIGADEYWYCHGDIVKTVKSSPIQSKVDPAKWVDLKESLKLTEAYPKQGVKGVKVPNDSCAIGFSVGPVRYYKCDHGLYRVLGTKQEEIDGETWNTRISAMDGDVVGFAGCDRVSNSEISCPDGIYKKDVSVSADRLVKDLEEQREKIKIRNRETASQK